MNQLLILSLCIATATAQTIISACCEKPKPRRYDLRELGASNLFHGWVDVQGQGAANDYCRVVGSGENKYLACALAGSHGEDELAYKSMTGFNVGTQDTWYTRDEDGDGRDDYCRCVGTLADTRNPMRVECMKSGPKGFYGSQAQSGNQYTFSPTGPIDCSKRVVRSDIGI